MLIALCSEMTIKQAEKHISRENLLDGGKDA